MCTVKQDINAAFGDNDSRNRCSRGREGNKDKVNSKDKNKKKNNYYYPINKFTIIKKKGLCACYLKPSYLLNNKNAPCKSKDKAIFKKEDLAIFTNTEEISTKD